MAGSASAASIPAEARRLGQRIAAPCHQDTSGGDGLGGGPGYGGLVAAVARPVPAGGWLFDRGFGQEAVGGMEREGAGKREPAREAPGAKRHELDPPV